MRNFICKKSLLTLIVVMAASFGTIRINAANYNWDGGGEDNLWGNPDNWGGTGAPVASGDVSIFNLSSNEAYRVALDGIYTNTHVNVKNDKVALDLNGYDFRATSFTYIGNDAGNKGYLTLFNDCTLLRI